MSINEATNELYYLLQRTEKGIIGGCSIKVNKENVIQILTLKINPNIPHEYRGYKVIAEITQPITFQ